MGFSDTTTRKLRAKLNGDKIRTREWKGKTLSYIEGWHALAEANRIFGFDGWNRETVDLRCIDEGKTQQSPHCSYIAKVRISVQAGEDRIVREGTGAGYTIAGSIAEAHALAAKEAETDATKRALATFGNPFGLALYDREQKNVRWPKRKKSGPTLMELRDVEGRITGRYTDAHACALAISRAFDDAETPRDLHTIWHNNNELITALQKRCISSDPGSASSCGTENRLSAESTIDLNTAYKERCKEMSGHTSGMSSQAQTSNTAPVGPGLAAGTKAHNKKTEISDKPPENGGLSAPVERTGENSKLSSQPNTKPDDSKPNVNIDKSRLHMPEPKRIRAPEHLKRVAQMPCLVCQRRPADAHHLKHAQPRAMARKPGDQWVVPLCRIHHRALHDAGDEAKWWQSQKLDPIILAERLWSDHADARTRHTRRVDREV